MGRKTGEVNSKEILYLQGDSISMKGYLGPSMGPVPDRAHWGLLWVPIQTNLWDHLNLLRDHPSHTEVHLGAHLGADLGAPFKAHLRIHFWAHLNIGAHLVVHHGTQLWSYL